MIALFAAAAFSLAPIHGVVMETLHDGTAIVNSEPLTQMQPAEIRRYRFSPRAQFRNGTQIDAFLDLAARPPLLRDAVAAGPFAPGLPDPGRVVAMDVGSPLPAGALVNQRGRLVALDRAFRGKVLLLSFVFTRCPDRTLCPAISGKFAYLQQHLDPRRYALAEITLDPQYDSPAVLSAYADSYGALPSHWSLLTGMGSTVQHLLDQFGISSLRVSTSNFLHNDRLFIVTPAGRVAYVVETADWDPQAVIAEAQTVAGLPSNPFERFKLALIANVIALCGGSQFAGIALLELTLLVLITSIVAGAMWGVARLLWGKRG